MTKRQINKAIATVTNALGHVHNTSDFTFENSDAIIRALNILEEAKHQLHQDWLNAKK